MIAFTICSNNYIPKAQVLASSIKLKSNTPVYLILADKRNPAIHYDALGFDRVISAEELAIPNIQWMKEHYDVVEFNTALKSFAFEYILSNTTYNLIYYFDPDIKVYQPLEAFADFWSNAKIVLTPHVLSPIPFDDKFPGENLFLNHGTFNLGFIGLKRSEITFLFLKWWSDRLRNHCIIKLTEGFFVDQIWFNLVPLYYKDDVKVIYHPGWNMAYWNLHERSIKRIDKVFYINENELLYFYHFSSFDLNMKRLSPYPQMARFSFDNRPDLIDLYQDYKSDIVSFDLQQFSGVKYFDGNYPILSPSPSLFKRASRRFRKEIYKMISE